MVTEYSETIITMCLCVCVCVCVCVHVSKYTLEKDLQLFLNSKSSPWMKNGYEIC